MFFSRSAWSGEIDALKASQDIKNLGNELKLEEAEKYFNDLVSSGDDWCISKGQCRDRDQERIRKSVEKTLNEVRQCVPAEERLPTLKYSNVNVPSHLSEAYNKCQEEVSWGYSIPEKPEKKKESKIKISS